MKNNIDKLFIKSIIFDEDPINIIKQNKIDNEYLDVVMNLTIEYFHDLNDMQEIDDYLMNNFLTVVNFIRMNYQYKDNHGKEDKYYVYNDLVKKINSHYDANVYYLYYSENLARGIYTDYKLKPRVVNSEICDMVRLSNCYDLFFYEILNKEQKNISEKEFEMLIMNTLFIYSVNYFYLEYSDIICENKILKDVLDENYRIMFLKKCSYGKREDYEVTDCLKKYTKMLLRENRW